MTRASRQAIRNSALAPLCDSSPNLARGPSGVSPGAQRWQTLFTSTSAGQVTEVRNPCVNGSAHPQVLLPEGFFLECILPISVEQMSRDPASEEDAAAASAFLLDLLDLAASGSKRDSLTASSPEARRRMGAA